MSEVKKSIKKFLPRSLLGRSLLILIIPVILIQVITTYVFFDRHWSKVTTRLAFAVAGEVTLLAEMVEEDGLSDVQMEGLIQRAENNLGLDMAFMPGGELDAAQKIRFVQVWENAVASRLSDELAAMLDVPFVLDVDFSEKWVSVDVQLDNGVLHIELPQRRLFSSSGYIFLLWMIGASFVLLIVAILFMRNQIRPIRRLAIAAERFGKGRDLPSFRPQGAREVRMAAQAFIEMHQRIRRQIEQRTAMLAGVSHDLRTPLTRLKLQIEMLGDSPDVDAMKSDIQHMERMIEGYLDFVRGEGDEPVSFVNFNEILDKVVVSAKRQAISIQCHIDDSININLRPMAIERCLINLVSNAGKYADCVWVSASVAGKKLEVRVEDNGPGIPKDQHEEVFKPFYRVDSSRNAQTGGVGLGLPIALDIVHGHGGDIELGQSSHGGLLVLIHLPL